MSLSSAYNCGHPVCGPRGPGTMPRSHGARAVSPRCA